MEKKMRIQLYDSEFNMLSDRLVAQDVEIRRGVREKHEGPLKIEICLFQESDVEDLREYLGQLVGSLPLNPVRKKRNKNKLNIASPSYREEFVTIFDKFLEDGTAIPFLKEQGFIFTSLSFLQDLGLPIIIPEGLETTELRWMIKRTKQAKNPLNNKYDPTILIGIKRLSPKTAGYIVITPDGISLDKEGAVIGKNLKVPPQVKVKFPHFLTADERVKLSLEIGTLRKEEDKKPSPLYRRWIWAIAKENEGKKIDFPRLETIPNPYK